MTDNRWLFHCQSCGRFEWMPRIVFPRGRGRQVLTAEERLSQYCRPSLCGCHAAIFCGPHFASGYGQLGLKNRVVRAHRLAYGCVNGPIPPKLVVRHTCDTPTCCDPAHLLLGTHAENVNDRVLRGRGAL